MEFLEAYVALAAMVGGTVAAVAGFFWKLGQRGAHISVIRSDYIAIKEDMKEVVAAQQQQNVCIAQLVTRLDILGDGAFNPPASRARASEK